MENQYPKALYRGEESAVAKSADHEAELVAAGFASYDAVYGVKAEPEEPKRTRRIKAEPEAE
jgi:hypothetical protein